MIYTIKESKSINPNTYKGRGRPRKIDYLKDLNEFFDLVIGKPVNPKLKGISIKQLIKEIIKNEN